MKAVLLVLALTTLAVAQPKVELGKSTALIACRYYVLPSFDVLSCVPLPSLAHLRVR